MKGRTQLSFTFIAIIIGFMLAIQFSATKDPVVRDTRDVWELRQDIRKAQQKHQQLLEEIRKNDQLLASYEEQTAESQAQTLQAAKRDLNEQIGLTEAEGAGIILTVERLYSDTSGFSYQTINPELLYRLINELNSYHARGIVVADQRIIATSPIRDVNGQTHINTRRLPPLPLEIKVLSEENTRASAERLHDRMVVSQSVEDFAIDGLKLSSTPVDYVTLPKYTETIRIKYMEPAEILKEDK